MSTINLRFVVYPLKGKPGMVSVVMEGLMDVQPLEADGPKYLGDASCGPITSASLSIDPNHVTYNWDYLGAGTLSLRPVGIPKERTEEMTEKEIRNPHPKGTAAWEFMELRLAFNDLFHAAKVSLTSTARSGRALIFMVKSLVKTLTRR